MMRQFREEVIGDARLILGDACAVLPVLSEELGRRHVGCVVTDPPYGMEFRSNYRTTKHAAIAGDSDDMLLRWALGLNATHSKYIFCRWDNLLALPVKPKSLVTWVKNNWSMGDLEHEHARQTEVIAFYDGPNHFFPRGRPQDVVIAPRSGNEHHPTEKPIGLMCKVIEWTDGEVFDPFMGSGSTGVAAVKLGRPFIGVEVNPAYFDIACRRIEEASKQSDMFIERPPPPKQEVMSL
jgi:site-specific DNA-methyltransferase (adenine-specific)